MAKHKPQIVGSIRIGGKVYRPGMEDEIEKDAKKGVFKPEAVNLKRLVEKGVILGLDLPETEESDEESAKGQRLGAGNQDPKEPAKEDPKKEK